MAAPTLSPRVSPSGPLVASATEEWIQIPLQGGISRGASTIISNPRLALNITTADNEGAVWQIPLPSVPAQAKIEIVDVAVTWGVGGAGAGNVTMNASIYLTNPIGGVATPTVSLPVASMAFTDAPGTVLRRDSLEDGAFTSGGTFPLEIPTEDGPYQATLLLDVDAAGFAPSKWIWAVEVKIRTSLKVA